MASAIVSSGAQDAGAKGGAAQAFVIVFGVISVRSRKIGVDWLQSARRVARAARFGFYIAPKRTHNDTQVHPRPTEAGLFALRILPLDGAIQIC